MTKISRKEATLWTDRALAVVYLETSTRPPAPFNRERKIRELREHCMAEARRAYQEGRP